MGRGWLGLMFAVVCVACAACDSGGGPPARGFGSRQVVELRDPTFAFNNVWGKHVLYTLGDLGAGDERRYFAVDIDTGEVRPYKELSELPLPPDTTSPGRYDCVYRSGETADGGPVQVGTRVTITDRMTGVETTIDGIYVWTPSCPKEGNTTLTFWRTDEAGALTLWAGPFDALAQVTLEPNLTIAAVMTFGNAWTDVYASLPGEPGAVGIYRIDLATYGVSERVPAKLEGAAWITGAPDAGPLESSTVLPTTYLRFRVGDEFLYSRTMSDGRTVLFAGPYASGPRELALFEQRADKTVEMVSQQPADGVFAADRIWLPVFRVSEIYLKGGELLVWDRTRQRLVRCVLPAGTPALIASRTAQSEHLLFEPRRYESSGTSTFSDELGSAVLVTPAAASEGDGSGACTVLADRDVAAARLSPDGTALFWLVAPEDRWESDLWTAAADGSGRRLVGTGDIASTSDGPHFIGPSQLALRLEGDLDWFDVHDDPVRMRYIAERVFGDAIYLGRWLIIGHGLSGQDMTGRLGVVDRDNGDTRMISPDVVDYFSPEYPPWLDPWTTLRGEPKPIHVVYLVRGRNPSAQDGLWLATVNPSDVP